MAQKVITTLISDISGKEAQGTVQFSVDGKYYRLDLTGPEEKKFRDALAGYTEKAQKVPKNEVAQSRKRSSAPSSSARHERGRIREWANANGYSVGDRGRIAQSIQDAYYAAVGN